MNEPLFGDVLRRVMGKTPARVLAERINVHYTVVYRWRGNKRVPALNTDDVSHIIEHLGLDVGDADELRQAQITSLSRKRPHAGAGGGSRPKRRTSTSQARSIAVNDFIEWTHDRHRSTQQQRQRPTPRVLPRPLRATTVRGVKQVMQAATELIADAHPDGTMGDPAILISMQGARLVDALSNARGIEEGWRQTLRQALRRGWKIEHLWRLDKNIGRSLHIVESMLDLVEIGDYYPFYTHHYDLLRPPYEVMIVPGHAAMLLLATNDAARADSALVLTDPAQIELAIAHFRLLRAESKPLLHGFVPEAQELGFTLAMVDAEANHVGRMAAMEGLSALTYPESWLQNDSILASWALDNGKVRKEDLLVYLHALQRRLATFERNVQRHNYFDICPERAIYALVEHGQLHPHMPLSEVVIPVEQRLELINRLIYLLTSFDHYHLALLDEHEEKDLRATPALIVTGGNNAFITTQSQMMPEKPVTMQVQITEPTIVAAFRAHFADTWKRIAPPNRNKHGVTTMLKQQAEALSERIRSESGS